jgi:hypothetical protein
VAGAGDHREVGVEPVGHVALSGHGPGVVTLALQHLRALIVGLGGLD